MAASPTRVVLWEGLTAANGEPTSESDGFTFPGSWDDTIIFISNSAGTAPTVEAKLWVYMGGDDDQWAPLGVDPTGMGDSTMAGLLNEGFAIGVVSGNNIRHVEAVTGISNFKRLYLEALNLTGTPTLDAVMRKRREQ